MRQLIGLTRCGSHAVAVDQRDIDAIVDLFAFPCHVTGDGDPASLEIATRSESSSCASLTEIKLASTGSVMNRPVDFTSATNTGSMTDSDKKPAPTKK